MDEYIIRDIPSLIRTPRLVIRALKAHDGVKLNEAIKESFEELHPWMPWAKELPTPDETELFVREAQAEWIMRKNLNMLIFDASRTNLIGSSGFNDIDWSLPRLSIGYWVNTRFSGHGYIAEAVNALTRFAFKELQAVCVEIKCAAQNHKSRKVAQRLGFTQEAYFASSACTINGELTDTVQYVRFNPDGLPALEVTWESIS